MSKLFRVKQFDKNMKIINTNKYNFFFYASRIITLTIILFIIFCILNMKYSIFETFFENLIYVFGNPFVGQQKSTIFKLWPLYSFFIIFVNWTIYLIIYVILLIVLVSFNFYFSKKFLAHFNIIIINIVLLLIIVNFISVPFNKIPFVLAMLVISFILFYVNFYMKSGIKYLQGFCLIPIFGDFLIPNYSLPKKNNVLSIVILLLSINFLILLFSPFQIDSINLSKKNKLQILNSDLHSLNIDNLNRIITKEKNAFVILNNVLDDKSIEKINYITQTQNIIFDEYEKNFYIYDETTGKIIVFDENFNVLKENKIIKEIKDKHSSERICFDKNNIAVLLEKQRILIINKFDLSVKHKFEVPDYNDYIIYNKFLSSFMISFWTLREYFFVYSVNENKWTKVDAPSMQGFFSISEQNKEIYLAFHQKGRIYVYDAETLQLKRKIKTQWSVKNIYYDETLNVLIAPGYFTGYVDIFLMDGSDTLLCSEYIDLEIRDAKFDNTKQYLFVTSGLGLYKKKIDIVKLIEKYKNK